MAHISFYLPCEPFWHEGIYQLETSDFATGYDPVLATDGPANRQWKELGDRTLFLKAILENEHEGGRHNIKAAHIRPDTKIPERKLDLAYGTARLAQGIGEARTEIARAYEMLLLRNSQEISPAAILGRLLPAIKDYYECGASFDLLNSVATLREFATTNITREIAGDDSLDVESTAGIHPGNSYFLMDMDGGRLEEATVLSVLTDCRIRFVRPLEITRTTGILSAANIPPSIEGASIFHDFVWRSDWIENLAHGEYGKLFIHRDSLNITGKVYWQEKGGDEWHGAEWVACESFYDGTCDDVFILPGSTIRIRVEYPAAHAPWKLYWLALQEEKRLILPETVRRPWIESARLSGLNLIVRGCPYASLWELPQAGLEMRVGFKNNMDEPPLLFETFGESDGMAISLDSAFVLHGPLTVSIRHSDIEGSKSRWSDVYVVEEVSGD